MSFKKQFFRNVFVYGSFTFSTQLVAFLASLITSRLLLPSDFGLVGLISVFSNFITIFSDSGISYAVIRSQYTKTYQRGLNTVSLIIGVLLCIIFIALAYPIAVFYKNFSLGLPSLAIAFLFIARSVNIIPVAVLQKELNFSIAGKILLIAAIAGAVSTIIMAYAGLGYWSLIWSQFITCFTTTILVYNKNPINFSFRKPVIVKSFQLIKKLVGSVLGFNAINYWARNSDNLIAGKFYGSNDLGIYNRAYLMLSMPLNVITGLFSSVLYPSLVKHKHEGGGVEREYYFVLKILSLINIPIAIILILFPRIFVRILWGENWMRVAELLPYFGLLVLTQTLVSTTGPLMVLEKKEKVFMYFGWISAAIMIAGIIYGATISLPAIAAFYALVYLALVLPFAVVLLFKMQLNFSSGIVTFWLPKIILSLLIWLSIYKHYNTITAYLLVLWIIIVFWNVKNDFLKFSKHFLALEFLKANKN